MGNDLFGGKRRSRRIVGCAVLVILFAIAGNSAAVLIAIALHEGGHWLAAKLCGVKIAALRPNACGLRLHTEGTLSYAAEFIIALGGPTVNLLCFLGVSAALGCLPSIGRESLLLFKEASLYLGLFNLLPIGTMDGGRLLRVLLSVVFSPPMADAVIQCTSLLCIWTLWLAAAYALLRGAPMTSAFLFFLTLMIRHAAPDGKRRDL